MRGILLWALVLPVCLVSVGEGWTDIDDDSMLRVDRMDDAREDSRLGMPNILDAALAPELAELFSLTAPFSSLPLPFSFKVLAESERVRRVGILEGCSLFRFEPFGPALADVVCLLSNDVPERKSRAFRRDVLVWAFEGR